MQSTEDKVEKAVRAAEERAITAEHRAEKASDAEQKASASLKCVAYQEFIENIDRLNIAIQGMLTRGIDIWREVLK